MCVCALHLYVCVCIAYRYAENSLSCTVMVNISWISFFQSCPLWNDWGKLHLNRKLQGYQGLAPCQSVCFISLCYSLVVTVRARGNSYFLVGGKIPVPQAPGRAVLEWAAHFLSRFEEPGTLGMKLGRLEHLFCFSLQPRAVLPEKWERGTSCLLICMPEMPLGGPAGVWPPIFTIFFTNFHPFLSILPF